jgi:hypothetical protein
MKTRLAWIVVLGMVSVLVSSAWAQWSSNPAINLPLADKGNGNDQIQPKLKPLPNNGWWVSWFDSDPTSPPPVGYDVYLQRLNSGGFEQFVHDGILIADLSNTSTEDYGLDIDAAGNSLLAFLDTREGPSNQQVTAVKTTPSGQPGWLPRGVQLTNDSSFHAAPKIAGTSDGDVVVAWTSDSNVVLQRLDPRGRPLWGSGIVFSESQYNYSLADLHAADNGSVIVAFVRDQGFGSNRRLYANKVSSSGALLWGAQNLALFDQGSLQIANFPYFIVDGSGGAVFSWYTSSPILQCFAQHIRADGTQAFPHGGSPVSNNTLNVRVSPSAAYNAATDETFVFWTEEDGNQILNGVYGQKLDGSGKTQWGMTGTVIVPLGSDAEIFVESVQIGSGALVFWVDQTNFGTGTIQAAQLNGSALVTCPQFPVATTPASQYGLAAGIASSGVAALAWADNRIGNNAIYIQNVNPDCSLGPHLQGGLR